MTNQTRPTDLRERVFEFACAIVLFCRDLSKEPGTVRQIAWQLADAATSSGANLEEAKAAYSRRDFAAKNAISLKEMREALYWLRVIIRCNLVGPNVVRPLMLEADELTAMLTAGMKRLHPVRAIVGGWLALGVVAWLTSRAVMS
jgi:four helix bundle protein